MPSRATLAKKAPSPAGQRQKRPPIFKSTLSAKQTAQGQLHKFGVDAGGGRGGFACKFKQVVDQAYMARFRPKATKALDLVTDKLDRCHRVSYAAMRDDLLKHLAGGLTDRELDDKMLSIIGPVPLARAQWMGLSQQLSDARDAMHKGQATHNKAATEARQTVTLLRKVLNFLNNQEDNVTIGDAIINREIGRRNDFNFGLNTRHEQSLTPRSRRKAEVQAGNPHLCNTVPRVALAGGGTGLRSSHLNGGVGGTVPEGAMSPRSRRMIAKMPTG